ncbi:MAG: PAS domain S-box protein [Chloroflexi bacterium]|nr:PAS domain S-box protein [Chloroflexota bacterium]MDL1882584.1 PAS domain S-box protein [Anaerolineae bacterium CFX8]
MSEFDPHPEVDIQMAIRLLQIGQRLNAAPDEKAILDILIEPALAAGLTNASLLCFETTPNTPEQGEIVAAWQRPGAVNLALGTRLKLANRAYIGLWNHTAVQTQFFADAPRDRHLPKEWRALAGQIGARGLAILPLQQGGRWIGFISLGWADGHEFSDAERLFYSALPAIAAPVIASRRFIAELDELAREQTKALREAQNMLKTVIDTIPVRVFWKDKNLRYLGCNHAFAEDAGLDSPEAIIGKDDYELSWAEVADLYRGDDQAVIESGQARINYEEPQTHTDGSEMWLRTSKLPLRDADGEIIGVLGLYEDITEHKRMEQERERLQQQIIEAQRQALQELSTPIIPIMDRIIVMPLVGGIDTARARDIMRSLLAGIGQYRARIAILDITGVSVVDSGVAQHLDRTIQAARLKGAQTIVTGVSDAVAEIIVNLGIDWSGVETQRDLQTGLVTALERLGVQLTRRGKRT